MRAFRQTVTCSLTVAMLLALLPSVAAAAAGTEASVPVVVTDERGEPLAGARVIASPAWSSEKASRAHGGRRKSRTIATDRTGRGVVNVRLTRDERESVRDNNGWLNLTLVVLDSAGHPASIVATTRYLGRDADQLRQARREDNQGEIRMKRPRAFAAQGTAVTAAYVSCTYYWEDYSYPLAYTQIGELHRHRDTTTAKFTYGETADSNIEVGASWNSEASWSISGAFHVGNSLGNSVAANATSDNYHWALRSQFRYGKSRLYKDCLGGPNHVWTGSSEIGVMEWTGGGMTLANTLTQPTRNSAYSQNYGKGTEFHRTTKTLTKWAASVSISGATLGAQSGASTEVRIDYVFGSRYVTHYLYGNDGLPSVSSRVFQLTP